MADVTELRDSRALRNELLCYKSTGKWPRGDLGRLIDEALAQMDAFVLATNHGMLVARFQGDPGSYEGIAVNLIDEDGRESDNLAVVETSPEDERSPERTYPTAFHTFAYDGVHEEPVRVDFHEDGKLAWLG